MSIKNSIINKDILLVFILYSISHGLILINQGIYWDDWVLYNVDKQILIDMFDQTGIIWIAYFHHFMLSLNYSVFYYHLLVFIAYFMAAVFLYKILKNIKEIGDTPRLFITILFAILPVNSARIALIDSPYALCYFAFFLGFFLVVRYLITRNMIYRILALIVLLFSFFTNSLLMFYSIIFLYIIYINRNSLKSIAAFGSLLLKNVDFLLLPFVFWIIKKIYFVPYGLYSGYNNLELRGLLKAPTLISVSFNNSFLQVLDRSFKATSFTILLIGIILGVMMLWFIRSHSELLEPEQFDRMNYLFVAFGLLLFVLAVFPYNAVGLIPASFDWNSRHQLLIPLGASFILYYVIQSFFEGFHFRKKFQVLFLSLLIAMFINVNIQTYVDFQKDWYKQMSIIGNIRNSAEVRNHTTFLFDDHYPELNTTYGFYEYSGLMKEAFHEETRFGTNVSEFYGSYSGSINSYKEYFNGLYNLGGYVPKNPEYLIEINKGKLDINNPINLLRLTYNERLNHDAFSTVVKQVVNINCKKLDKHND